MMANLPRARLRFCAALVLAAGLGSCATVVALHPAAVGSGLVPPRDVLAPASQSSGLPRGQAARPLSRAGLITAYVQTTLLPPVLSLEGALATANHAALSFNPPPHGNGNLVALLDGEALVALAASHDLPALVTPPLDGLAARQMERLLEDLEQCGEQLAALLQDTATALAYAAEPDRVMGLGYWPGVHRTLALLRRAEGWLETIDRETDAHVRLPGFGRGDPPLDAPLAPS
jgi:hypothetical protein